MTQYLIGAIDSAGGFSNLVQVAYQLQIRGLDFKLLLPTDMVPMGLSAKVARQNIIELPFDLAKALEGEPDVLESSNTLSLFIRGAHFVRELFGVQLGRILPPLLAEDADYVVIGNSLFICSVFPILQAYGVTKTVLLDSFVAGSPLIDADSMLLEAPLPPHLKRRFMSLMVHLLMAMPARQGINRVLGQGGRFHPTYWEVQKQVSLTVFAIDPLVLGDTYIPPNVLVSGMLFPDHPSNAEGNRNLERIHSFLPDHPNCLFVTWGSRNPSKNAHERLQRLMRVAASLKVALIIQTPLPPKSFGFEQPGDILFIDGFIPHLETFAMLKESTAASAYFGATGPGATHTAILSGLPIVTLKSGYADQWFWAQFFAKEGCVSILPHFNDTALIAASINAVLSSRMQANAKATAPRMRRDGLARVTKAILELR